MSNYNLTNEEVHELLNNAVSNGYAINTWSVDDICDDLAFCDEIPFGEEERIKPFVVGWLEKYKEQKK